MESWVMQLLQCVDMMEFSYVQDSIGAQDWITGDESYLSVLFAIQSKAADGLTVLDGRASRWAFQT